MIIGMIREENDMASNEKNGDNKEPLRRLIGSKGEKNAALRQWIKKVWGRRGR